MKVNFKFAYGQCVKITAFGLGYEGRVARMICDWGQNTYNVEYAADGKLERGEFREDEIEALEVRS